MRPTMHRHRLRRAARRLGAMVTAAALLVVVVGGLATPAHAQPAPPDPGGLPILPDPTGIISGLAAQLAAQIHEVINSWFRNMIANAFNPVLDLLSRSLLATPDLTAPGSRTEGLWWTTLGLANTGYVLLIVIGGVLVMSHQSLQTSYAVKDIAPRLVTGLAASNLSLLATGWAIDLANGLASALLNPGLDPGWIKQVLWQLAVEPLGPAPVMVVLLAGVVLLLAIGLILTYLVRVSLTILLIVAAPLALACHALPQTEGLARLWWRAFAACLLTQVAQALTLITVVQVFLTPNPSDVFGLVDVDLVGILVTLCLLWVLFRIPFWAFRAVYSPRASTVVRLARTVVIGRALGALWRP